ncbi:MAG TPA: deoxyguanosinetriphosphate triphosphohydrolase [Phycisphaerae bacterium]|nr:deoxyguanosinetriphosphate triphosphohydrolase [Phycisphaerae bacterium]HRW52592.1 deoxyguanosinetriphosphate triphosphohydrolase [Phycisphaerae bacterium]
MTRDANDSLLAPFAVHDRASRGRRHERAGGGEDSPFDLDRHRIISCTAFRRLMYKTQVFVTSGGGDHYRTRLTHTLEVAAQAERFARELRLNPRLAGAIALAHDLGHSPFGHAGEKALDARMKDRGGFEHNVQSLRVVDYLEHPYPAFRGLNLTFELREALVKHRTKYDKPSENASSQADVADLLASGPNCTLEGQAANLADAVAYTLHDIEDGLWLGILSEPTLQGATLWREAAARVRKSYPDLPIHAVRRPIIDTIASRLAEDVRTESARRIDRARVKSVDDVRACADDLLGFSESTRKHVEELQALLLDRVYRDHKVVRMDAKARRLIDELFDAYLQNPKLLPDRYARRIPEQGPERVICDYIAGMTDRFCQEEHQRIFSPTHFE